MPRITILDQEGRWNPNNEDEYLWWPRVLWIDPGVVSGVAVVWFDPKALLLEDKRTPHVLLGYTEMFLHGAENGQRGQISTFLRLRDKLGEEPGLATGCESFRVLRTDPSDEYISPVRIRAGIEHVLSVTRPLGASSVGDGVPLHKQAPSDAITAFKNDRLKALRMYREGPDHVNDAKRHCLLFIRRLKAANDPMALFRDVFGYEEGWFQ